ncbi:MAG: peptide MFS transporter [Verrucomicrobia bacterium]|nr:peptide MFS transporter [Verrucomicrobiota bacterium]
MVLGTGLLKPNMSTMVGELYPEGGARRDAGFTIFYMGINIGAFLGPLFCSFLGERVNWHYGFCAAGVGMVLGLVQYRLTGKHLGEAGLHPHKLKPLSRLERWGMLLGLGALGLVVVLGITGLMVIDPIKIARKTTTVLVALAVCYFAYVLLFLGLEKAEKRRVWVIIVLFVSSALFFAGFEQAGSSFSLFAERYTNRSLDALRFVIPTGWFQMLGPIFVVSLAPVMAALWVALARRGREPSLPAKFGGGLILLAAGFLVMAGAAKVAASGHKAWPTWLIATFLLHTFGELCVSPVGLSSVTKLAPRRLVGQMMGAWFLATSVGNLFAGLFAGEVSAQAVELMSGQYLKLVWMPVGAGIVLLLLARPIARMGSEASGAIGADKAT